MNAENRGIPKGSHTFGCRAKYPAVLFLFCSSSIVAREEVAAQADIMDLVPCQMWSLPACQLHWNL